MKKKSKTLQQERPSTNDKVQIVEKLIETIKNLSTEGMMMDQSITLTPMEVISGALKAILVMGIDFNNAEHVDALLAESRRIVDKAAVKDLNAKKGTEKGTVQSFVDPMPSKLIH